MEEINNKRFALPVGTSLKNGDNEYRIVKVLGAGGFGITYKVSAKIKLKNVTGTFFFAVKEFFMGGCDRADDKRTVVVSKSLEQAARLSMEDFITEARRLNHLSGLSKHIVQVNEVFKENNTAYYVMEFLDGGNLQDIVEKDGPMTEQKAISVIKPVANALSLIHKEFILHQDVKPENIVMKHDPDTGESYPVIIDFGISKHFSKDGKPTSAPLAKGASDGYAPIEQYSRIESFQPKIDVYALAATLLYLISGKSPKSAFEITPAQIKDCIPSAVSQSTADAILHAMKKLAEDRTEDVNAFLRELGDKAENTVQTTTRSVSQDRTKDHEQNNNGTKAFNDRSMRAGDNDSVITRNNKKWLYALGGLVLMAGLIALILTFTGKNDNDSNVSAPVENLEDSTKRANITDSLSDSQIIQQSSRIEKTNNDNINSNNQNTEQKDEDNVKRQTESHTNNIRTDEVKKEQSKRSEHNNTNDSETQIHAKQPFERKSDLNKVAKEFIKKTEETSTDDKITKTEEQENNGKKQLKDKIDEFIENND